MFQLRHLLCIALLLGCGSDALPGGLPQNGGDGDGDHNGDGDGDDEDDEGDEGDGDEGDGDEGDGDTGDGDGDGDTGDGDTGDGDTGDGDADAPSTPGGMPDPAKLPKVSGTCPTLKTGSVTLAGATIKIWVGSKPGPLYMYFHGTGTSPGEIDQGIPGATSGVKTDGGIAASWDISNKKGTTTGTIWYTGDLDAADQLVACGIKQGLIDTARIHVSGYSAGGLETGAFIVARSHYLASAIVYSGGKPFGITGKIGPVSMVGAHGAAGSDNLGIDFGTATPKLGQEVVKAGGFAIDCDDGGGHVQLSRLGLSGKARDFFKAHAWGVKTSAIPAGFPSNCKILK